MLSSLAPLGQETELNLSVFKEIAYNMASQWFNEHISINSLSEYHHRHSQWLTSIEGNPAAATF